MMRRTWLLGTAVVLGGGLAIGLFQRQDGLRKQAIALTDQAGGSSWAAGFASRLTTPSRCMCRTRTWGRAS